MKNLMLAVGLMLLFAAACNSEKKDKANDSLATDTSVSTNQPVDSVAMMQAWEAYMTPGDVHRMLTKDSGKWNAEMSFYHTPGQEPSVSTSVAETKMILGGRYQQSTYKGIVDGMPFEGIATVAYDNSRKVYISTWIDNMGTGIMYLEGTYDEASKTLTSRGKATDVVSGKDIQVREVLTFVDDNTQMMEMYDAKDGKEAKTMMIKLTRAK